MLELLAQHARGLTQSVFAQVPHALALIGGETFRKPLEEAVAITALERASHVSRPNEVASGRKKPDLDRSPTLTPFARHPSEAIITRAEISLAGAEEERLAIGSFCDALCHPTDR